jgi:uncharacterized phage protein (TIGR02216 family)
MSPEPAPFPWKAALQAGLCRLRLDPATFWAMTPVELAIAVGVHGHGGGGAPGRQALEALMLRFPDRSGDGCDGAGSPGEGAA